MVSGGEGDHDVSYLDGFFWEEIYLFCFVRVWSVGLVGFLSIFSFVYLGNENYNVIGGKDTGRVEGET